MNILFLLRTLDPSTGGIQRVTSLVSRKLENKGINCFFAYKDESESDIPSDKTIHLRINHFCFKSKDAFLVFLKENSIDYLINQDIYLYPLLKAFREIKKKNICKIINYFHLSPNFFLYDKRSHIRLLDFLFRIFFQMPYHVHSRHLMYDIADRYVMLSETFKSDFQKLYKISDGAKLFFIPNPLTYSVIEDISILSKKKKQVLILTRFNERQKNICSALRIWKKIEQLNPVLDWKLLLGGYGQDEKMILNYAESLNLRNFIFLGKVNKAKRLYEESSVFMMTSKFEGFGMTLTEAQQNACVPIAFNTFPVLGEIIDNGSNGFCIENENEADYAEKLNLLIKDDELRTQMSKRCLDYVRKYEWNNLEKKWLELLGV